MPAPARAGRGTGLLLVLWPMVGFTLGLATLFGPVMWITGAGRESGWSQTTENAVVAAVIILYVAVSSVVALWLTWGVRRSDLRHVRLGIPALVAACTAGAVWLSMTPSLMAHMGSTDAVGARFTIGPYPDEEALTRLKAGGYTGVISLLHPAVVPFEPRLLAEEKAATRRIGIDLIHLPMLPWVSANEEALAKIEELAAAPGGRYYVHCYLGRDRVSLVRRVIEQTTATAEVLTPESDRSFRKKRRFERGEILELDEKVYLIPYPTDEEFVAYFATGLVKQVLSLLDPDNEEDATWIEKERNLLALYGIPLEVVPVPLDAFDPRRALEAARRAWTLPRPLVVHAFLAPSSGRSPSAVGFMQAFLSGRPPLPPSLFSTPMEGGAVEVVAPNIAVGPRPTPSEFGAYLVPRGVREFVYVGDPDDPAAREDADVAADHDLSWRAWDGADEGFLRAAREDGPWYLYGPGAAATIPVVAGRHGPAVPDHVAWDAEAYVRTARLRNAIADRLDAVALLQRALPGPRLVVLLGPVLLIVAAIAAASVGHLRQHRGLRAPYTRKIFHFTIFTLAACVHVAAGLPGVALFGAIVSAMVLYAVWRGPGFAFYEAMARPSDDPHRSLFILVPLATTALGGLIGNVLFAPFAFVGYLVGGWGDAVGEPVGTAWGRHRYKVPSLGGIPATRSLEGSAAVLLVGVAAATFGLLLYGVSPLAAVGVGLACGVTGALVEAFSNHGLDNLTIQVAAAGTAFFLLVG